MSAHADEPIADEVVLYRRVPPRHLVPDENRNCTRISTSTFKDRDDQCSVALGDDLDRHELAPESVLGPHKDEGYALVAVTAADARSTDAEVRRAHLEDDPTHGVIAGKLNKGKLRTLNLAARWVVRPDGACDPPYVRARSTAA